MDRVGPFVGVTIEIKTLDDTPFVLIQRRFRLVFFSLSFRYYFFNNQHRRGGGNNDDDGTDENYTHHGVQSHFLFYWLNAIQ